jgi:hypothetical protein
MTDALKLPCALFVCDWVYFGGNLDISLSVVSVILLSSYRIHLLVTLRFKCEKRCVFVRDHTYDVESTTSHSKGILSEVTQKVVTTRTDSYWSYSIAYQLYAFQGNKPDNKVRDEESERIRERIWLENFVFVFPLLGFL